MQTSLSFTATLRSSVLLIPLFAGLFASGKPVLAAAGDLDTTFDGDGKTTTAIGVNSEEALGVAVQTDGRIVAGGYSVAGDGTSDFAAVRYNSNGSLDGGFNGTGKVTASVASGNDRATAIGLQPDGKIVLGGFAGVGAVSKFALVRLNTNGSLDTTLGGGKITVNFSSGTCQAAAMLLLPDGRIVLGGFSFQGSTSGKNDFALACFTSNGQLDPTFGGGDGLVTTDFGNTDDNITGLVLTSDGKIVATGSSGPAGARQFALARYTSGGILDTSFGNNGLMTTTFPGGPATATCATLMGNGRIIVGGYAQPSPVHFAMARYMPGGALDTSFGNNGLVENPVISDVSSQANAITFQKGGKIVLAGSAYANGQTSFCVARYDGGGALDNTFGGGDGIVTTPINTFNDVIYALAIQSDGKIVAAGGTNNGPANFALARYSSGSVDLSPQISGFTPAAAPIGAILDITGLNFNGVSSVQLGSTLKAQGFQVIDANHIRITGITPGTDSGKVRVTTGQGTAVSTDSFHLLPQITNFSPTSGPVGATITINGTGFRVSNGPNITAVRFAGPSGTYITAQHYTILSKTQLTVKVPVGAQTGPIRLRATYGVTQSADSFVVTGGAAKGPSGRSAKRESRQGAVRALG